MSFRTSFEKRSDIGTFVKLTNSYCLLPDQCPDSFRDIICGELPENFPVVKLNIFGCRIIGRLAAGNKKGLLVPDSISDSELKTLRDSLPESVEIKQLEDKLSALGNVIVCNDKYAIVHPELEKESVEILADTLDVEVFRESIGAQPLVGSYAILGNSSGIMHPVITKNELEEWSLRLDIPVSSATINNGSNIIGNGIIMNDDCIICGSKTTFKELENVSTLLKKEYPKQIWFGELHDWRNSRYEDVKHLYKLKLNRWNVN